jgi:hypothetical protein
MGIISIFSFVVFSALLYKVGFNRGQQDVLKRLRSWD